MQQRRLGQRKTQRGAEGPRDGQTDRKGQGRPQGKRSNCGQKAETGSGGELVRKGHSTPSPGAPASQDLLREEREHSQRRLQSA
eukprot:818040-Pleurochrysis_carterae.AAC.3